MTYKKSQSIQFFSPPGSGDPIGNIIAVTANIIVNFGMKKFSLEMAKKLGLQNVSTAEQLKLAQLKLQVTKEENKVLVNQRLYEGQLAIIDLKIKEKELELEERRAKIRAASEQQAQLDLPHLPAEFVTGALEISASSEGLIPPDQADGYETWLDSCEGGKVILILGKRGSGKTALAAKIAEYLLKTRKIPIYWIGLPDEARNLLPHWITIVDSINKCPPGCFIMCDEAGIRYLSLAFATAENVILREMLMICRHKNSCLCFAGQSSRDIDYSIIRGADTVIFKEPGLLQVDSERPAIRPKVKEAAEVFQKIPKNERQQFAHVFDDNFKGLIQSSLPSFWSEELSHIYAKYGFSPIQQAAMAQNQQLQGTINTETKLLEKGSIEQRIIQLRKDGAGYEAIAKNLDCSVWKVRQTLSGIENNA